MNKKRGFTLIELIITMCIMAVIGSGMAFCVSSYHVVKNNYEVKFAENSILGLISNAKQYCREKNKDGNVCFYNDKIEFRIESNLINCYKMPDKIKVDKTSTININNKGIIAGDACTITIKDDYGKRYDITICVGTFYVEIKE